MDLIKLMTHLLEQCDSEDIVIELIDGFCRIVLRGHLTSTDIMTKLLLKFFNPDTGNPFVKYLFAIN
jgi:condensin complex subunit 3